MDRDSDSFAAIAPSNTASRGMSPHLSLSYHRCCIISIDPLRVDDKGLIQNSGDLELLKDTGVWGGHNPVQSFNGLGISAIS